MEPAITGHEAVDHDDLLVHTWRVARLTRLGIPALLAEIHADHLHLEASPAAEEAAPEPALTGASGHPAEPPAGQSRPAPGQDDARRP